MKTLAAALLLVSAAHAESIAPCDGFDWPMSREVGAIESAPSATVSSGAVLDAWPDGAIHLALTPGGEKDFPVPPERAPKGESASGYVTLPAPSAGTFQVSLSAKAWIDVIQDGKPVPSGAHTSDAACPTVRKSVRFDLVAAPVTLQISGADATSLLITIMPAAD